MKQRLVYLLSLLLISCATAPPAPSPTTAPPVASAPNRWTPLATIPISIAEPRIRVGLQSDQSSVVFPRIAGGYYLSSDAGPSIIKRGFTISAPLANAAVRFVVQASAISDLPSATAFAEKIRREASQRVDAVFDPAAGQYKILVGDFPDAAAAEPLRGELLQRGYAKEMQIVRRPASAEFAKRHAIVDDEGDRFTIDGESILILPASAETITIDAKPYRTAARVFINSRGLLNVINELNLEEYLRGVVPAELGPRIYDELEAQKAQTIAARTYAVRNLGQFRAEGYDICPGPACQAYKGFSGEEALSDQAIRQTAGLIMTYEGKPIDALYTSTCGGETSDVGTMFPGRNEPYLRRARCIEFEMVTLGGRADSGLLTEQQLGARMFVAMARIPEGTSWSSRDVENAVQAAMRVAGVDRGDATFRPRATSGGLKTATPRSTRRGDVLHYLAGLWDLDTAGRTLTFPDDRRYFFPAITDPDSTASAAAAFLIKFGMVPAQDADPIDLDAIMPRDELYALLGSWLREMAALQEVTGKISAVNGRNVVLKAEGKNTTFSLPENIPIFRRLADRSQEYRSVPIMIGDRAFIQLNSRREPVSMIVNANYDGASFDRTSSFANWTRSFRADELVTSINRRNPIQQLVDLRPLVIDASKRIAELEVTADGGRTFVLRGLPVRWSLNVPDNLFVYQKSSDPDGVARYTFYGKGWGHGTGLCQVGAYGMAFRGWSAEKILKNFYTGVEIVRWTP